MADHWNIEFNHFEGSCDKQIIIGDVQAAILAEHPLNVPEADRPRLRAIVTAAYDWNVSIHRRGVNHYFRPVFPRVGSPYDPATCELYLMGDSEYDLPNALVAAVVSIGLETSDITGAAAIGPVTVFCERKARVLM